jgi:beta-lactam-binding protein with PASTA domain
VRVPNVIGIHRDWAQDRIYEAKLLAGDHRSANCFRVRCVVVGQSPHYGETVPEGTKVDLWSGPSRTTVPDITALVVSEAQLRLETSGLVLDVSPSECDPFACSVIRQTPSSGSAIDLGGRVTVEAEDTFAAMTRLGDGRFTDRRSQSRR